MSSVNKALWVAVVLCCLNLTAISQNISLKMSNVTVKEAMEKFKEQSGYSFVFFSGELDTKKKISISADKANVEMVVKQILVGQNVSYKIEGKNIVIKPLQSNQQRGGETKKTLSGTVKDNKGEPLIGASVVEKGTTNGTVTNAEGKYTLRVADGVTLNISYIGYVHKQISVPKGAILNVVLDENSQTLNEVIVVGYGSMKRSDITGSVASVKIGDVSQSPIVSADQLLKGRSAGVYANTSSAEPGGTTNIIIRGSSSLSSNNQPLYVIDDIPIDNTSDAPDPFADRYQAPTNPLSMLNPQDIQSIEVLKDASATAIYGSRGANGVVLITTKSGKQGKMSVNWSSSVSFDQAIKKIDVLNGPDFARYKNEVMANHDQDPIYDGVINPAPEDVDWKNWQNEVLRTAVSQNHRVSLSGGDKTSTVFMSAGFLNNEGIIKKTKYQKSDFRVNYDKKFTDRFSVTTTFAFADINSNMSETNGNGGSMNRSAIRSMISKNPIVDVVTDYDQEDMLENNPINWINDYSDDADENTMNVKLGIKFKLTDWMEYQLRSGYNYQQKERLRYYGRTIYPGKGPGGLAGYSNLKYTGIVVENIINFKRVSIKEHSFDGLIGATFSQNDNKSYSVTASKFPDDFLRASDLSLAEVYSPSYNSHTRSRLLSYLARANYQYSSRYYVTVSFRADGSSKFADGNKFSYFPSVALAWRVSEESFLKNIESISNLKLRLGWGQTGNQGISPYATLAKYSSNQYPFGGIISSGLSSSNIENLDLIWETSQQANLGLDLGLFDSRFNITADIYHKNSKSMLIHKNLPPSSGFEKAWVNFGQIKNKGFELSVDGVIVNNNNWKVTAAGNFSLNRNEISDIGLPTSTYGYVQYWGSNIHNDGDIQSPANTFIMGQPIGLFWGYKTNGVYQSQDQINKFVNDMTTETGVKNENFLFGVKPIPGDIIFVDKNGDGKINQQDKQIIGNPNPDYIWGFNGTVSYKNIELSFLINGVHGRDILNANLNRETTMNGDYYNIRSSAWEGRWTGPGTSNYYPKAYMSMPYKNQVTDRLIEDGSYVRLSSITLSYILKLKSIKFIQNIKVFVTGNNLLTFTGYSGFDPEVDSFANDPTRIGIDNNSYPSARSIRFGVNLNF